MRRQRIPLYQFSTAVLFAALFCLPASGQNILETGEGFQSTAVSLGETSAPEIRFDFGFSTDEDSQSPNTLFDSFTVSLQDVDRTYTAIFVTADSTGFSWAPSTPGTLALESDSILRTIFTPIDLGRSYNQSDAFHVSAPIPEAMRGLSLNLYFDLYDNQNGVSSAGWFSDVTMVPEPGITLLGLAGLALCSRFRRSRHRDGGRS